MKRKERKGRAQMKDCTCLRLRNIELLRVSVVMLADASRDSTSKHSGPTKLKSAAPGALRNVMEFSFGNRFGCSRGMKPP